MTKYFSDKSRSGIIKIENSYDGYIWDYTTQAWQPCREVLAAINNRLEFDEITPVESEIIRGLW